MSIKSESYENINFCQQCGSKLQLQDDHEKKLRLKCSNCGFTFYKNPIPASACVIINDQNKVVVIKRKFEPNAGGWALPSGYVEIDQTPEECAAEEMQEETGLIGEVEKFLGYYTDHSPIYEKVISFGFLMKVKEGELRAGDDAAEARYVDWDDLPDICFPSHKFFLQQAMRISREGHEKPLSFDTELLYKEEVYEIVGAAIEVHKELGNGYLESVYKEAMEIVSQKRKIPFETQKKIPIHFKGTKLDKEFVADYVGYDKIIVEFKCIPKLTKVEVAQIINYLKATGMKVGVLINFRSRGKLEWKRYILT
ncbi:MAG: GxxExxY protein [Candidatus Cloacimonetes bacterium]|nr:GxxExxY protein [Candidatus Cloacimonadota bacterium]MCF7814863.1 GxxExxY protein [Candidatus Cloacimonadota bacterium]MCF7867945.1 GxxExxY protein [Candidatus Cloacimonadota bacterium]MCF7883403.1 GxxExxY protein [Candidatus Cloacimonadota bacterium]